MKKLTLFFMALLVFNVSFAKEKEKIDTTFTFQGYSPASSSSIRVSPRTKITKNSKISYPSFIGGANSDIVKNMNAIMENFISRYKSTKHVSYSTSYEVTAENSLFLSVLFTINLTDNDTGQKTVLHNAISYNLKSGKQLQLKDLFVDGFNSELTDVVNSRFKQFGLPQIDKLDDIDRQQSFYLENDALVLIFNKGEASNFADGEVYIPFLLTDLIGLLR